MILKEKLGDQCFFVFLAPPSYEVLKERLQERGLESKESQASLERRLENAVKILAHEPLCDLTIMATEVHETVAKIQAVIEAMEAGESIPTEHISMDKIIQDFERNLRTRIEK